MNDQLRADIEGMTRAHDELVRRLAQVGDDVVSRPSRLPGWSIGHVLCHIARNGESVARRLEAAGRAELVDQYPGGAEGRAAAIEAGAARPTGDQVADIVAVGERTEGAIAVLTDEAWDQVTRAVDGTLRPARTLPAARWREIEVHHVDLGLGYEPGDWPTAFVERALPDALASVGRRLPGLDDVAPSHLLGWAYGRSVPPAGLPDLLPY